MHGGAPSALIGALVTGAMGENEQVARVQIDLERPVPLEPLVGLVRRRQVSRRVAHLEMELSTPAGRAVSARALLTRWESISIDSDEWSPPQPPDHLVSMDWNHLYSSDSGPIFVRDAVEHRLIRGGYGVPVSSAAWLRLKVPVIDGTEPCGLSQLLGVADFGSPLSQTTSVSSAHWSLVSSRRHRASWRGRLGSRRDGRFRPRRENRCDHAESSRSAV